MAKKRNTLLKMGKGFARIPMAGLRELERAGTKFAKVSGRAVDSTLKEIRKEISLRKRK